MHIPRWLATSWGSFQAHVFCDASERAYVAALYIRSNKHDKTLIRLVCSKNRLAPVKRIALLRLEILAALVGTQLLHYFCTVTVQDINQATLWSDATVALRWICSDLNHGRPLSAIESRKYKHTRTPRNGDTAQGWTTLLTISHRESLATK